MPDPNKPGEGLKFADPADSCKKIVEISLFFRLTVKPTYINDCSCRGGVGELWNRDLENVPQFATRRL